MEQSLPSSNLEHMLQEFEVHFLRSYGLEKQNTSLKDIPGRNMTLMGRLWFLQTLELDLTPHLTRIVFQPYRV